MSKCKWCGGEFAPKKADQAHCCSEHRYEAQKQSAKLRRAAARVEPKPKPCLFCEKEFTPQRSNGRFCSNLCQMRHRRMTEALHLDGGDDISTDPEEWAVTTPYFPAGGHSFDGWVSKCLTGAAHV